MIALLCYVLLPTSEPIALKQPVCCYDYTELIGICEKKLCEDLLSRNPNISMERVQPDGTCLKK